MKKNKQIYIVGDTHNDFSAILWVLSKYDIKNSILIGVGDFGAYWDKDELNEQSLSTLNNVLIKKNIDFYTIRGNHDNPKNFDNRTYGNVHLVKDYSVLNFNNYNFLMVGGAVSIDKERRQYYDMIDENVHVNDVLFKGEEFNLDRDKISKLRNINIVITHSAPLGNYPYTIVQVDDNPDLEKELIKERQDIETMKNILIKNNPDLRKWFYGHYHKHYSEKLNDIEYTCLGKNEIYAIFL